MLLLLSREPEKHKGWAQDGQEHDGTDDERRENHSLNELALSQGERKQDLKNSPWPVSGQILPGCETGGVCPILLGTAVNPLPPMGCRHMAMVHDFLSPSFFVIGNFLDLERHFLGEDG